MPTTTLPASFESTLRPNSKNPDFPTEPSDTFLEKAAQLGKKGKEARSWALKRTQEAFLSAERQGCGSQNLDALRVVRQLREGPRQPGHHLWVSMPYVDAEFGGTLKFESREVALGDGVDGRSYSRTIWEAYLR